MNKPFIPASMIKKIKSQAVKNKVQEVEKEDELKEGEGCNKYITAFIISWASALVLALLFWSEGILF